MNRFKVCSPLKEVKKIKNDLTIEKNNQTNKGEIKMKKMKHILKNEKGLTLIELLAVIVILAIVAAIAVPSIGNIIENSRVGAIKADAQTAMAGAKLYFTENQEQTTVTVSKLVETGFLESGSSLESAATTTTITKVTGGSTAGNTINGSGSADGMTVVFTAATNKMISEHKNSSREAGAVAASKTAAK